MKHTSILSPGLLAAAAGLALAGSASLGLAADIKYTFDSDVQGWYAADNHGAVAWDATHGRNGGGCLAVTIKAGADTEVDPRVDVDFDTTTYFTVECDIMVDPGSGVNASGNYGGWQFVARDSSWSWDGMWIGTMDKTYNTYQHVKKAFVSAYGSKAHLQLQVSPGAFSGNDITIYIDNVVVRDATPPTKVVMYDFAWPEEVTNGVSTWTGGTGSKATSITVTHDTTKNTNGCLKAEVVYNTDNTNNWQEGDIQLNPFDWDSRKFTWLEFDLYVDAPAGQSDYGIMQVFEVSGPNWSWTWCAGPGLAPNVGKWVHYQYPLVPITDISHGLIFQAGGGMKFPVTYYIANVQVWQPVSQPTLLSLTKSGPAGVTVSMSPTGGQWERNALVTPASAGKCFWKGETPVTYSFTISDFPDAIAHHGFEAHLFICNGSTRTGLETDGAADWGLADLVAIHLTAADAGGYDFSINWKTNTPDNNPPGGVLNNPASVHSDTAIGTWSVTFRSDTEGTLSGPGGLTADFTIPADAVNNNFNPGSSFLQFGMFKNDGAPDGHNDNAHGTFSRVQKVGGSYTFDDSFTGSSMTANYAWRTTSSTAVTWTPVGTAWWLTWSTPDTGFVPSMAANAAGPYNEAAINYMYAGPNATRVAAIPASILPAGNSAYFRLFQRQFTKLLIVLPGETLAPGTPTGKTGTPTPQANGNTVTATVYAVDDTFHPVAGISDAILITCTDDYWAPPVEPGATLPLVNGQLSFTFAFGQAGSFSLTVSDYTDPAKGASTSGTVSVH